MDHFASAYAIAMNEMLHSYLISTWHYKHEIYEIPNLFTALLITYDDQEKDEYEVHQGIDWNDFLQRMSTVKPDWIYFDKDNFEGLAQQPGKSIVGWEGRTIYFIRGGSNPDYWSPQKASEDARGLILASAALHGPMLNEAAEHIDDTIPRGQDHFRAYEDFVRISINYLFTEHLGEAKAQVRTEPGNEGIEIRDLLAHNTAETGFFSDLKMKYACSEILFDAKNTDEISRDDLRQIYCYLKPAIGNWGFIVCRTEQSGLVHSYNRTLFKNFAQSRGVLIVCDDDIRKMISMKLRERDPSEHLQEMMSIFVRGV